MRTATILRYAAQAAVSLALVAGVIWWTGPEDVLQAVRDADPRWLAAAVAVFAVVPAIHGVRWWVLLRPVGRIPLREAVLVMLAAKAVGLILPLRAGALLQVQLLGRRYELNRGAVAGTLVLEAAIDAVCFLILFVVAAPLIGGGQYVTAVVWATAGVVILVLLALFLLARPPAAALSGDGMRAPLFRLVRSVREGLRALRSPGALAAAVVLTFSDWFLAVIGYALAGRALGLDASFGDYLLVEIVANLAGAIPFTQSGIGAFEVAASQILSARGVPENLAGAFAVGAHALQIATWLVTGAIALMVLRVRPGEVLYVRAEHGGPHPPA
ncbi:MAG: lysylphosphatidylglycerol synthase transmembrane domain-containing protein, partial [Dehalococcoidia bacterium]